MLTVRQVAEQVGLSDWAIRRAIHDGELAAFKPRGQLRIRQDAVDEWLDGTRVVPAAPSARPTPVLIPSPSYPEGGTVRSRLRRRKAH